MWRWNWQGIVTARFARIRFVVTTMITGAGWL